MKPQAYVLLALFAALLLSTFATNDHATYKPEETKGAVDDQDADGWNGPGGGGWNGPGGGGWNGPGGGGWNGPGGGWGGCRWGRCCRGGGWNGWGGRRKWCGCCYNAQEALAYMQQSATP